MKSLIISLFIILITSTIALYISVRQLETLNLHIEKLNSNLLDNVKLQDEYKKGLADQMSRTNVLINEFEIRNKRLIPAI